MQKTEWKSVNIYLYQRAEGPNFLPAAEFAPVQNFTRFQQNLCTLIVDSLI